MPSGNRCQCSHTREAHDPSTSRCYFCRCTKFSIKGEKLDPDVKLQKPGWHDDTTKEDQ